MVFLFLPPGSEAENIGLSFIWRGGNRDGDFLKVVITEKEKAAIERGLNQGGGAPEVIIKIENGKVVVLKVKKEKIS